MPIGDWYLVVKLYDRFGLLNDMFDSWAINYLLTYLLWCGEVYTYWKQSIRQMTWESMRPHWSSQIAFHVSLCLTWTRPSTRSTSSDEDTSLTSALGVSPAYKTANAGFMLRFRGKIPHWLFSAYKKNWSTKLPIVTIDIINRIAIVTRPALSTFVFLIICMHVCM